MFALFLFMFVFLGSACGWVFSASSSGNSVQRVVSSASFACAFAITTSAVAIFSGSI